MGALHVMGRSRVTIDMSYRRCLWPGIQVVRPAIPDTHLVITPCPAPPACQGSEYVKLLRRSYDLYLDLQQRSGQVEQEAYLATRT